jgi:hypothetical protein
MIFRTVDASRGFLKSKHGSRLSSPNDTLTWEFKGCNKAKHKLDNDFEVDSGKHTQLVDSGVCCAFQFKKEQ